jgi:predicted peptidase
VKKPANSIGYVYTINEVFPDGQKVTNVVVEYAKEIDPSSISTGTYEVKNRNIIDVHTNSNAARTVENVKGKYVVIDLEIQDPLLAEQYATDGRPAHQTYIDNAVVIQKDHVRALDGTVYHKSDTEFTTSIIKSPMGSRNKIFLGRGNFEGNHYYTDREWGIVMHYNICFPKGYQRGNTEKEYPLILFMADAGAVGRDWEIPLMQGNGGTIWAQDEWQNEHPCFVVTMVYDDKFINDYFTLGEDEYYENVVEGTMNLVKYLKTKYPVDGNRIYTTGQSMGAMCSLIMMSLDQDLFAGAYILAGQWSPDTLLKVKDCNMFILNSEDDNMATKWMDKAAEAWEKEWKKVVRGNINGVTTDENEHYNAIKSMLAENTNLYYLKIKTGTGSMDITGNPIRGGHRSTWCLGYNLPLVKEWLFNQTLSH